MLKIKILIPDKINKEAIKILENEGFQVENKPGISVEECSKICSDCDAMIVRSGIKITKEIIDSAKNLKIIVRAGVGYDNIDTKYAAEKGVVVENTPFGNTNAAAEHTLTLLMMLGKHIIHSHVELKKGIWDRKKYRSIELQGKTLGIIGLGNIGKKVAKVANALEMSIIGCDPFVTEEEAKKINVKKVEFDELVKESDFITVHVPKIKETINMIAKPQFEKMKEGVRILNVARGGIINENDLAEAIKSGKVAATAIDVWEEEPPTCRELIELEQVISTPHLGASTEEAQINVAVDAAKQILSCLKEGKIINCVNGIKEIRK